MKKKILIVDKSFVVGGIQSSMINLIKSTKDIYDIDLCVFNNEGEFKDRLPKDVRVIKVNPLLRIHGMSVADAKRTGLFYYLLRLLVAAFDRIFTNKLFFSLAMLFQKPLKGYDVAIAYHHEVSKRMVISGFYRFIDKKTDAKIKLGWIHYDPFMVYFDDRQNEKYMEKMTKIICVSKGTAEVFTKRHPNLKVPIDYCYNMHDIERILEFSKEKIDIEIQNDKFNCFSACRFGPQKAMPRAIRALAPVLKKYTDVRWYIAGNGEDMAEVKRLVSEYGLEDSVILLGSLSNPYPYFAKCDLYIQPSIYEAAPMVYGEAIICKIPILTTDNISAEEMVPSEYGIICENSEEGIRKAFLKIIEDRGIVSQMKKNLESGQYSNQGIIEKLDSLFA